MLRLRLSRQPIRKHLPTGAGTVHSISRVSGPEALPTMGSGSPGKPPHVCGASMCGHTCVACYPRIRSRDLGWFRTMRPWDSLRDDRAHCSAPSSSALAATTCCIFIIHQDSGDQFGRWTSCWFRRQSGLRRFFCGAPIAKSMVPGVLIPFRPLGRPFPHIPTKRSKYWRNRSTTRLFISSYALLGAKRDTGGSIDTILVPSVST